MNAARKNNNMADMELQYYEITELYDLAEELIETVDSELVSDKNEQYKIVKPLVENIGESTDILAEEFVNIAGGKNTAVASNKIETYLRKIYSAIDVCTDMMAKCSKRKIDGIINIAEPIVQKIKRQVEIIVAIFVDFIDISLNKIMQKQHIDELRKRQEKIAVMLYEAGQCFN